MQLSVDNPQGSLLTYLRHTLGLKGSKEGCGEGHCGACTVLINGRAERTCQVDLASVAGARVETIEALNANGVLHPLQEAFVIEGAVQCGFCTPGMIMAAKGLLDKTLDPGDEDIREALKHNLCRCTGYQAVFRAIRRAAEQLKQARKVEADAAESAAVITQNIDKVTGRAAYIADLGRPGMLYGKLVRADLSFARILKIITTEARNCPGVVEVLTARDIPGLNGFGPVPPYRAVLAKDMVRYPGDYIALVLAETEAAAEAASQRVQAIQQPFKGEYEPGQVLRDGATKLHPPDGNLAHRATVQKGTVHNLEGGVVVEGTYTIPPVEHAYIEPEAALAEMDEEGRITVWSNCAHTVRRELARVLNMREQDLRVVNPFIGASFGGKQEALIPVLAALGTLKTGRTVRIAARSSEEMTSQSHAMQIRMKHTADKDGRLVAVEADIMVDCGAYPVLGKAVVSRSAITAAGPYVIPNCFVVSRGVYTNNQPGTPLRGFGTTQVTLAAELQMDRLAEKLGMDSLELRRVNALRPGEITATGQVVGKSAPFTQIIAAVQEKLRSEAWQQANSSRKVGVGTASAFIPVGSGGGRPDNIWATAEFTAQGGMCIQIAATESGQGLDSALARIAAKAADFPLNRIRVCCGDSDLVRDAGARTASRQIFVAGNAAKYAALQLGRRLREKIGVYYEVDPDSVYFDTKVIRSGDEAWDYEEVYNAVFAWAKKPQVSYFYEAPLTYPLTRSADRPEGMPADLYRLHFAHCFGAMAARIEVDTETGEVSVSKVITALDPGRVINRPNLMGQIEGSVVMGIGIALSSPDIVAASGVPEIESILIEEPDSSGPFGAKGLGELPLNLTVPAILNGIYQAIGVRFSELPVTPSKILAALQERNGEFSKR